MSIVQHLEGASVMRVRPRQDRVLTARQGRLWVTLPGDAGTHRMGSDHVLRPGDRLLLRAGEKAVISSGLRGCASTFTVEAFEPGQAKANPQARQTVLQSFMMSVLGWRFAR